MRRECQLVNIDIIKIINSSANPTTAEPTALPPPDWREENCFGVAGVVVKWNV